MRGMLHRYTRLETKLFDIAEGDDSTTVGRYALCSSVLCRSHSCWGRCPTDCERLFATNMANQFAKAARKLGLAWLDVALARPRIHNFAGQKT